MKNKMVNFPDGLRCFSLRLSRDRYRSCYDDRANLKMKDKNITLQYI